MALTQIKENNYVARAVKYVLQMDGVDVLPSNIRCVGMNMAVDDNGMAVVTVKGMTLDELEAL